MRYLHQTAAYRRVYLKLGQGGQNLEAETLESVLACLLACFQRKKSPTSQNKLYICRYMEGSPCETRDGGREREGDVAACSSSSCCAALEKERPRSNDVTGKRKKKAMTTTTGNATAPPTARSTPRVVILQKG